jgi:hypothetical protein
VESCIQYGENDLDGNAKLQARRDCASQTQARERLRCASVVSREQLRCPIAIAIGDRGYFFRLIPALRFQYRKEFSAVN